MMPINAAFITADGKFVPSNLLEKKSRHKFVWVNAEQGALYLDMKVMPQPLREMCLLYQGYPQWYPGKRLLIKR